jgi:outer membrane protein assembly factor BamD (BamD/ComL family)
LLRARQELSSDPSGALALTQEHARRFPSGTLSQEREVLAIEALARLGRTSEARRRLDAFRSRFPQSPHVARLATLVGP